MADEVYKKNKVPNEFKDWKSSYYHKNRRRPTYNNLNRNQNVKGIVKNALIVEQGGLCCYCGTRIDVNNSIIEHFKPQLSFTNLDLDYGNLLVSCEGSGLSLHCGHKKGNWFNENMTVSPLDPKCEEYFTFGFDGSIRAKDGHEKMHAAKATIENLGLDTEKLRAMREAAISAIYPPQDEIGDFTKDELLRYMEYYKGFNGEGQLEPFCFVLVMILERELSVMG